MGRPTASNNAATKITEDRRVDEPATEHDRPYRRLGEVSQPFSPSAGMRLTGPRAGHAAKNNDGPERARQPTAETCTFHDPVST